MLVCNYSGFFIDIFYNLKIRLNVNNVALMEENDISVKNKIEI